MIGPSTSFSVNKEARPKTLNSDLRPMYKSIAQFFLLSLGVLLPQLIAFAHDSAGDHFHDRTSESTRMWTITESGATIEGTFVAE